MTCLLEINQHDCLRGAAHPERDGRVAAGRAKQGCDVLKRDRAYAELQSSWHHGKIGYSPCTVNTRSVLEQQADESPNDCHRDESLPPG